jgi:hypothetical protein
MPNPMDDIVAQEQFRLEGVPSRGMRLIHENVELSDADGTILMSWVVNFPSPVMGSVALLQVEAVRRVAARLDDYLRGLEAALKVAHPSEPPDKGAS